MNRIALLFPLVSWAVFSTAQTNIRITNNLVDRVLVGQYDPSDYKIDSKLSDHQKIICGLQKEVNTDSLKSYLTLMEGFHTRHTYSDTSSSTQGIGAARRWAFDWFQGVGKRNDNRLIPSYLEFDYPGGGCGDGFKWKNILAVLPGSDTTSKAVVIIEGHFDTRCEDPCDVNCLAAGIDDNGSGSALVMELARVMAGYSFNETLVFMLTIGEEQGLYGAKAMAQYCDDKGIKVKAVLNNDVVGGIICGLTSSPPSCVGEGSIDSTQVRIFSNGLFTAPHRSLARTIKLYYDEKLKSIVDVPMTVTIINQEDRTGRGGDHIPFNQKGYPSIRFTAANEHGDAHPDEDYKDRQHSTRDVLGLDTNGDQKLDIYYVDFNYLKRNAVINGTSVCLIALGPVTPSFVLHDEPTGLRVEITGEFANEYRIGVRELGTSQEFAAMYRTTQTTYVVPNLIQGKAYRISVAGIDNQRITSPFSGEDIKVNDSQTATATTDVLSYQISCDNIGVEEVKTLSGNSFRLSCVPNPNNGLFTIKVATSTEFENADAKIVVTDFMAKEVTQLPFQLHPGMVEVNFEVALSHGQYIYSLYIDGKLMESKQLLVH